MLALGLLFILAAAAVTTGAIYDGGESASFEVFNQTIGTSIAGVFLAGVLTMLVFMVGVWMLMSSMGRSRRKRADRKETKTRQRESVSKIEEERAQLRAENERLQEQVARDTRPASTSPSTEAAAVAGTGAHAAPGDETRIDESSRPPSSPDTGHDGTITSERPTDLTSRDKTATSTSGRPRDEI